MESMNFASMEQIRKLWGMDGKYDDSGMPILFNVFNNFYGMGGQTQGETMGLRYPRTPRVPASTPSRCTRSA